MNAPSHILVDDSLQSRGAWPVRQRNVLDWLVNETSGQRFIDNLLVEMCERLIADGVPVARVTVHVRTNNPEWMGARMMWKTGMSEAELTTYGYGIEDSAQYQNSPIRELNLGASEVRRLLDDVTEEDYDIYRELHDEGYTDYVAWPIEYTLGKRHSVTFASMAPGGFSDADLGYLRDILPALALVSEIRIKNRLVRTLLETYVGPHASEQILAGATTRGSGTTVGAAILICDLRDFTAISDAWPRDDVIDLLNGYFDAMCEPIEAYGGEILKFMGDGLLAVFPLSDPDACLNLMRAIADAQVAIRAMNERNARDGHQVLSYGIGVHVGDVMYGNIGSRTRLDFTVIGPAVNIASRIESLTKVLKRPVLMSRAFVDMAGCATGMENLGFHPVKGIGDPIEVLAFPDEGPKP